VTAALTGEAQAKIAAILARVERTLLDIQDAGLPAPVVGKGIMIVRHLTDSDRMVEAVVGGLADIVAIVAASDLPPSNKRDEVTVYENRLMALCGRDRASVLAQVHRAPWWRAFLDDLSRADLPASPPPAVAAPPALISVNEQIRTLKQRYGLTNEELAEATAYDVSTVERHVSGKQPITRLRVVKIWHEALRRILGPDVEIALTLPPPPPAPSIQSPRKTAPAARPRSAGKTRGKRG
jgi:hypothetical protein